MRGFDGWNERRWSYEPPLILPHRSTWQFLWELHIGQSWAGQCIAKSFFIYVQVYGSGLGPFIIWLGPKNFVWVLFFLYISYPYQLNIIISRPALRSHPVIFRSSKKDGKVRVPKSPLYRVQTQSSPSYGRSHGIAAMQHLWRMCLAKFIFFQKARFTFASGVVD